MTVRPTLEEEPEPVEARETEPRVPDAAARPVYKMAPGTQRRPFGGRVLTRDNMDVPAFMRKQMD